MQLKSTIGWQLPTDCQVKFLLLCCKMKKKEHLTREQRYQISALLQAGHKQKEIAEIVGEFNLRHQEKAGKVWPSGTFLLILQPI